MRPFSEPTRIMKQTVSIRVGELKSALTGLAKIIDPRSPNEVCRSVMVVLGGVGWLRAVVGVRT